MDEKILNSLLDYAREYMGAEIPFNNKWIIENFLIAERIKLSEQQSNCNLPHVSKSEGITCEAQLNAFIEWHDNLSIEESAWYEGRYLEIFKSI